MLDGFWAFLNDPANREVLGWIGGGFVVVAGGVWAVVKFVAKKREAPATEGVKANRGSVAIGGDNTKSHINVGGRRSGKR